VRKVFSIVVLPVEHMVEVVNVNSFGVADDIWIDSDKSLHVVSNITGEAGAEESEHNLRHDRVKLDDVEHRLLDKSVIAFTIWHQRVIRAVNGEVKLGQESSSDVCVVLLD